MVTCDICFKEYKNLRSLSTHRYKIHSKKRTYDQLKTVIDQQHQKSDDEALTCKHNRRSDSSDVELPSKTPENISINYYDIYKYNKDPRKNRKHVASDVNDVVESFENSISDNTHKSTHSDSCKKCAKRQKKRASYKTYKNDFRDDEYNFDDYLIWIRTLCQCVLNRLIRLRKDHIDVLKLHEEFIRKVAHEKIKDVKKTMLTNPYALEIILNTIAPLLEDSFEIVL